VRRAAVAPEGFDARFSAVARVYRYAIDVGPWPDPFTARWTWHRPGAPGLARMRAAASLVVGEHDFASFCRHPGGGRSTVRHLHRLSLARTGDPLDPRGRADAVLHQMVRALVGTLVAVGEGRIAPADVEEILRRRDRSGTPPVAPPQGLTLERVVYARPVRRAT